MRGKELTVEDRDEILRGICKKLSDRSIAAGLGGDQSVISREITETTAGTTTGCMPHKNGTRR